LWVGGRACFIVPGDNYPFSAKSNRRTPWGCPVSIKAISRFDGAARHASGSIDQKTNCVRGSTNSPVNSHAKCWEVDEMSGGSDEMSDEISGRDPVSKMNQQYGRNLGRPTWLDTPRLFCSY
jgi:hypothetical protein